MNPGLLILALCFGLVGWHEARRFKKEYGRTPWGWHPIGWGAVFFFSLLLGLVLILISERAGKRDAANRAAAPQPWGAPTGYTPPPFGDVTFAPDHPYAAPPAAASLAPQPPTTP